MQYRRPKIITQKNGYSFSFRNSLEKSLSTGQIMVSEQSSLNQTVRDIMVQQMQQTPKFVNQGFNFVKQIKNDRKNRLIKNNNKVKRDSVQSFGEKNQNRLKIFMQNSNFTNMDPYFINNNSNTKIGKIQINYNNFNSISPNQKHKLSQISQIQRSHTTSNPKIQQIVYRNQINRRKAKSPSIQQIYLEKIRQKIYSKTKINQKTANMIDNYTINDNNNTSLIQKLIIPRGRKLVQAKQYNRNTILHKRLKNDKLKDLSEALKNDKRQFQERNFIL